MSERWLAVCTTRSIAPTEAVMTAGVEAVGPRVSVCIGGRDTPAAVASSPDESSVGCRVVKAP